MTDIIFKSLSVDGAQIINVPLYTDIRGYFSELYNTDKIPGMPQIKQVSQSSSKNNVIRGLHFQYSPPMCKMIRVLEGAAIFYVVDVRPGKLARKCPVWMAPGSSDFLFVPAHCAVGFQTVDYPETKVEYFHSENHNPDKCVTIAYDDPDINIQWHPANEYVMSDKDKVGMSYKEWLKYIQTHNILFYP